MNKHEKAETIAEIIASELGGYKIVHIGTPHEVINSQLIYRSQVRRIAAAIVGAMELPATEDKVVPIYRFQLKAIESALFTVANQYKCREQNSCLDRMVAQAEQFATNALNGEMDKTVRYGVISDKHN
jgi:hypothetical protein